METTPRADLSATTFCFHQRIIIGVWRILDCCNWSENFPSLPFIVLLYFGISADSMSKSGVGFLGTVIRYRILTGNRFRMRISIL